MRASHSLHDTADRLISQYNAEIVNHPASEWRVREVPEIKYVFYVDAVAAESLGLLCVFCKQIGHSAANDTEAEYCDVCHLNILSVRKKRKGYAIRAPRE